MDRISNPRPLALESDALQNALHGRAYMEGTTSALMPEHAKSIIGLLIDGNLFYISVATARHYRHKQY